MADPKIQAVLNQFATLMEQNPDIAAFVVLATNDYAHYAHFLETSWNCIKMGSAGEVRIVCTQERYPDKEQQNKVLSDTISMLSGFSTSCRLQMEGFDSLLKIIGEAGAKVGTYAINEVPPIQAEMAKRIAALQAMIGLVMGQVSEKQLAQLDADPKSWKNFVLVSKSEWERLNSGPCDAAM